MVFSCAQGADDNDPTQSAPEGFTGKPTDSRTKLVQKERDDLLMLGALAYLKYQIDGAPGLGGPIGALLAWDVSNIDETPRFILDRNRNKEMDNNIYHAEMSVMMQAYAVKPPEASRSSWLENATVYATLEPCPMCASTMILQHVPYAHYCMEDSSMRDTQDAGHSKLVPVVEHYHGRTFGMSAASLDHCQQINSDMWDAVHSLENPDTFRTTSHIDQHRSKILGAAAQSLENYDVQYPENEELAAQLVAAVGP